MPEDRRLAAIMFTDIVGYTAIMGSDEDKAFKILRKNRNIQKPLIKKYHGKWLKEMGDGILASFNNSSDAVRCAGEIQQTAKKEGINLRIGIHEGEVVFEGGDVLGDGVNVASRLEELAEEGCINISGSVYKDIKNKAGIVADFVEEKKLKNVDDPIKIYDVKCEDVGSIDIVGKTMHRVKNKIKPIIYILSGILVIILAFFFTRKLLPVSYSSDLEKSIAVLPLDYLSEDANKEYLANGVMDAITGHLSTIDGLRVMPRTSVEQYRETTKTSQEIGKELDVSYLVEGSFQMVGNQVKLIIQLIIAERDDHLFFSEYNRDYKDILIVQSELAKTIAKEIGVAISTDVKQRIELKPTDNQQAYEYYLRAKDYYYKDGESNLNTAIHFYIKAIELDSNFALAYAWLGSAIHDKNRHSEYLKESYGDTLLYYANKSLEIDPKLADGHFIKGRYYLVMGNYEESITQMQKGLRLKPNSEYANRILAYCYYHIGDIKNSIINIEKAKEKAIGSPDYRYVLWEIGSGYKGLYDYDRAKKSFEEIVMYDPIFGYTNLGYLSIATGNWDDLKYYADQICKIDSNKCAEFIWKYYGFIGEYDKALDYLNRNQTHINDIYINNQHRIGYLYYLNGDKSKSNEYFNKQIEYCKESIRLGRAYASLGAAGYDLAGIYAFLGEKEKAYQILYEVADKLKDGLLWFIKVDPLFESLWDDQEFKDIITQQETKYAKIREELDQLREKGII